MKSLRRSKRVFSEALKKKIVGDYEQGKATVAQISREYEISKVTVYRWLDRYSVYSKQGAKLIVELKSESYRSKELEKKVKELEAALGRKQLEVEFLNKLIEVVGKDIGIDIKKKGSSSLLTGLDVMPKKGESK
jgi:transposase-like protein